MIDTSKTLVSDILTEQFIPDHVFVFISKGTVSCFDGNKNYTFKSGSYLLARKNRLAKYTVSEGEFEPIIVCFEERFLRKFQAKHNMEIAYANSPDTFIKVNKNKLIPNFIRSLKPYYDKIEKIDIAFQDVKNEELLIILLKSQPELAGILFNFGSPEKVNLEEFMNRNYKFNVTVERFAYLTGRSLSAFKRDFKETFNATPNHWLVQRRLEEAYLLIAKEFKKPSDIYLDLGFEALSHFSFAFKKQFGVSPSRLVDMPTAVTPFV